MTSYIALILCSVSLFVAVSKEHNSTQGSLLELHNDERTSARVQPLEIDEELCEYAQTHAEKMAKHAGLTHSSMSNLSATAGNGNVGENIAWGQPSERDVMASWMNSPGHRQNIMSGRFKRVGFGVKEDSKGRKYWCAVFAA